MIFSQNHGFTSDVNADVKVTGRCKKYRFGCVFGCAKNKTDKSVKL